MLRRNAWYADAVTYVRGHGLMSGTSTTTFSPEATTSRDRLLRSFTVLLEALRRAGATIDGAETPRGQAITKQDLYELGLSGGKRQRGAPDAADATSVPAAAHERQCTAGRAERAAGRRLPARMLRAAV